MSAMFSPGTLDAVSQMRFDDDGGPAAPSSCRRGMLPPPVPGDPRHHFGAFRWLVPPVEPAGSAHAGRLVETGARGQ